MQGIYRINIDSRRFKSLDYSIREVCKQRPAYLARKEVMDFSFNNLSFSSWWPKPEARYTGGGPGAEIPDVSLWLDGSLSLSPKANRYLGELLRDCGEFLPVTVNDEVFYIFNCLRFGEEDTAKCHRSEGYIDTVTELAFEESVSELVLFKSKLCRGQTLYCNEIFKRAVESLGLTGIAFSTDLLVPELGSAFRSEPAYAVPTNRLMGYVERSTLRH
ncbi:hypothetical protein EDC56_3412 [Sinobacterium caligoides]|uniref:Uncharacterized protein n=1 Tax=Sinobacterium caligoides TaxID=933926 RepID=A0A3N2DFU6_9GAMM|nr:hypothetical protein [Sinobacterium caligoides]ROR98676.1 hypothetical protein EDC56_3412 [Sinobacterium caligoides]